MLPCALALISSGFTPFLLERKKIVYFAARRRVPWGEKKRFIWLRHGIEKFETLAMFYTNYYTRSPSRTHEGFEPRWALSVDHLLRKLQAHQFPLPPHQGLGPSSENGAFSFSLRCNRTRTVPTNDGPDAVGSRQSYFQSVRMVDLHLRPSLASLPFFKWDLRAKFI